MAESDYEEAYAPESSRGLLRISSEKPDLGGLFDSLSAHEDDQGSVASHVKIEDAASLLQEPTVLGVERGDKSPQEFAREIAEKAPSYLVQCFTVERAEEVAEALEKLYAGYRASEQKAAAALAEMRKLGSQQAAARVTLASSKEAFPVLKNKSIHLSGPLGDPTGKTTKSASQVSVHVCSNIVEYGAAVEAGKNALLVFSDLPALMLSNIMDIPTLPGSTTYLLNQHSRAIAVHEVETNKTLRSNFGLVTSKGTTVLKEGRNPSAHASLRAYGSEGAITLSGDTVQVQAAIRDAEKSLSRVREQAKILDPLQDLQQIVTIYCSEGGTQQAARAAMVGLAWRYKVDLLEYRFHASSRGMIKALASLGQIIVQDGQPSLSADVQSLIDAMNALASEDDVDLLNKVQGPLREHREIAAGGPAPEPAGASAAAV